MKNRHNQIWARIGMTLSLMPDEMELLVSGNDLDKRKCLSRIFMEGRAVVNGDSYIPDSIMEKYNETYGAIMAWTMRIGGTIWRQNTRIYPKMSAFL